MFKIISIIFFTVLLGCTSANKPDLMTGESPYTMETDTMKRLEKIPALGQPQITIAVYEFTDQTGQRKPNDKFSQLSTAVTQAPQSWVINALKAVGGREDPWFIVLEREGLDNLVKERQLIRSTRDLYDGEQNVKEVLKPLVFAGLLVEGGIVGYDSNITSGGAGARYFGIGVSEQYRTDQVAVAMRVIAVQTGEVLMTVSANKTIASYQTGADVFRFFDLRTKALEIESGAAVNEPIDYAIRSAIEYAVLKMVEKGEKLDYWKFKKWRVEE